jgi:hypothetical protein
MPVTVTTVYSDVRPENASRAAVVAGELKRLVDRDGRFRRVSRPGVEFLLSMGLTVTDSGDRADLFHRAVGYAGLVGAYSGASLAGNSRANLRRQETVRKHA